MGNHKLLFVFDNNIEADRVLLSKPLRQTPGGYGEVRQKL